MEETDVVKIRSERPSLRIDASSGMMDDFIRLPYSIYKDCPQYVPDLESDIRNLFDQQKNPAYKFAEIQPFVPEMKVVVVVDHNYSE